MWRRVVERGHRSDRSTVTAVTRSRADRVFELNIRVQLEPPLVAARRARTAFTFSLSLANISAVLPSLRASFNRARAASRLWMLLASSHKAAFINAVFPL